MARPPPSQGEREKIGSKGIIKKQEFIKLITDALYSLGYNKTGALLEEESGIPLYPSNISLFKKQLCEGKWDESVTTLSSISLLEQSIVKSATFLIMEQKFFETLSKGFDEFMDALSTLQNRIAPLGLDTDRVRDLASCLISSSKWEVLGHDSKDMEVASLSSKALKGLQRLLPPTVMIPEKRLEHLVEQALDVQVKACTFHNSFDDALSLYSDHHCGRDQIPCQTLQVLEGHSDEVWFVQFSHNGKYLASGSKDKTAIIWEIDEDGKVSFKYRLYGHQRPVITVSWNPDDTKVLTCGQEEVVRCWDINTGNCLRIYERPNVGLISCTWFPDGAQIACGMTINGICVWDLDGKEITTWVRPRVIRISDLAVLNDGTSMMSRCGEKSLFLCDRVNREVKWFRKSDATTSFSLSKDCRFVLISLNNQEIHVCRIDRLAAVSTHQGHKQARHIIRSCFGGFEEGFIASGSEDSQVFIWHRSTKNPLFVLPGHSAVVNSVSWNPTNLHMLASGSDDGSIRIWGLKQFK